MHKKIISIIGDSKIESNSKKYQFAYDIGKLLVDNGYRVQSGGLGGVMSAAFEGAHFSKKYVDGDTIAIIPSFDAQQANPYADIVIPTGIDIMRNTIVVNTSAVIAVGGGAGTLSEIANAWALFKLIIGCVGVDGWSDKLAGQKIDTRNRYPDIPDDKVYAASSAAEVISLIEKYVDKYTKIHTYIGI